MLLLNLALASPTVDRDELRDARVHAEAVVARCQMNPRCPEGDAGLGQAFLVQAIASAVLDGEPDADSAANARALAPEKVEVWEDLMVAGGVVSPWVAARLLTTTPPTQVGPLTGRWLFSIGSFWGFRWRGNIRVTQLFAGFAEIPVKLFMGVLDVEGGRSLRQYEVERRRRIWSQVGRGYLGLGVGAHWERFEFNATAGPALFISGHSSRAREVAALALVDLPEGSSHQPGVGVRMRLGLRTARGIWIGGTVEARGFADGDYWLRPRVSVSAFVHPNLSFVMAGWASAEHQSTLWGLGTSLRLGGRSKTANTIY